MAIKTKKMEAVKGSALVLIITYLISSPLAFATDKVNLREMYLQQGHSKLHEGKIGEAIGLYKKSLAEDPEFSAAQNSLKDALQQQEIQHFT